MPRRILAVAIIVILLASLRSFVLAQNFVELSGTVADETGAVIVGASLELEERYKYATITNWQGRYRFSKILPGKYIVKVRANGFALFTKQLDLTSQQPASLNVVLKVFISDLMEVKSGATSISTDPDQNLSAITLTERELEALPDDPDQLLQTLRMMAGAMGNPDNTSLYVDGFRQGNRLPPKRAIQMIRINSNPFAAEFSEPGRNRIEITTKPGSDRFHGEFSFNFNDESLNARNVFASERAPLQIRSYDGYFGGPLIPNRWDFLVYAGRWEQDENSVVNAIVIDPVTLQPQPLVTTVLTPTSSISFSLHTNYLLTKKQTLGVGYSYTNDEAQNQGLQSGFDLPERAFNSSSHNNALRFSLTTVASKHMVNQVRLQLKRNLFSASSLTTGPAILVFEGFNAGGNQGSLFTNILSKNLELAENLAYVFKNHTLKAGFRADAAHLEDVNRSNFSGTFSFGTDFERNASGDPVPGSVITPLEHYRRTLLGLTGYRPSQFSINLGDPFVGFTQWEWGWFVQDDWRVKNWLTLSYGLRHEFQTHLENKLNFAPRFSIALIPDKNRQSAIRIGSGVFYDYLSTGITFDTIRLDGRQQQYVIESPAFFPIIPTDLSNGIARSSLTRIKSADLKAPYSIITTANYERQLPWRLLGSIGYTWQRGVHLLRTRNINAPVAPGIRPFPATGPILQFESTGLSTRRELKVSLQANVRGRLSLFGHYTLSSTRSDTDSAYMAPADSYNLTTELARANSDQRHRFLVGGSVSMPWGVRASPYIFITSGRPFNITTGRDNNGDTLFTDRPSLTGPDNPEAISTRFGIFNPNPRLGEQVIPRNFGQGPRQVSVNMYFSRTFGFNVPTTILTGQANGGQGSPGTSGGASRDPSSDWSPIYLTLSINTENLFNHTNFAGRNGVLTSPFFGRANRALSARRIELALRLSF